MCNRPFLYLVSFLQVVRIFALQQFPEFLLLFGVHDGVVAWWKSGRENGTTDVDCQIFENRQCTLCLRLSLLISDKIIKKIHFILTTGAEWGPSYKTYQINKVIK